jgi:hypothetical protein
MMDVFRINCGMVSPNIPCIRLRFFLRSQPAISEVGCATGVGPRSSRATKNVSRFEVWMENVLSKTISITVQVMLQY